MADLFEIYRLAHPMPRDVEVYRPKAAGQSDHFATAEDYFSGVLHRSFTDGPSRVFQRAWLDGEDIPLVVTQNLGIRLAAAEIVHALGYAPASNSLAEKLTLLRVDLAGQTAPAFKEDLLALEYVLENMASGVCHRP